MHKSELDVLQKLQEGKTPEEQRRLELAAMYLVEANKGANVNDQLKPFLDEMVSEGAQYKQEQQLLQQAAWIVANNNRGKYDLELYKLAEGHPNADPDKYFQRTFDYTIGDRITDFASRNQEIVGRTFMAAEGVAAITAGGVTGMEAFGFARLGAEPAAAGLALISKTSIEHGIEGFNNAFTGQYDYTEGTRVANSFIEGSTSTYFDELIVDTAGATLEVAGTVVLGKGIASKAGAAYPKNTTASLREQRIKRPEGGRDTISLKEFEDLQNGKHLEGTKAITLEVRFEQKAEAEQIRWGKNKLEEFDFPTPTNNKQRFVEAIRLLLKTTEKDGG